MRLFGTVNGRPAICVGYVQGKSQVLAVCLVSDTPHPVDVPLIDFLLPRMPKKLRHKIHAYVKQQTKLAQKALIEAPADAPVSH